MTTEAISIGVAGGEDFAAERSLRPSQALVILLDSAVDAPGAFGRRQNDLRAALDGDGTVLLLIGPRIADGLATRFVRIRAKICGLVWLTRADSRSLASQARSLSYVLNLRLADPAAAPAFVKARNPGENAPPGTRASDPRSCSPGRRSGKRAPTSSETSGTPC